MLPLQSEVHFTIGEVMPEYLWMCMRAHTHTHTHTHTLEFTCVWKYIFSLCMAVSPFFSPAWTMNWLSMFNSQFHHRLVRWSWQSYIPSLCFIDSFYIYSDGSKSFYNWICMRINWECVWGIAECLPVSRHSNASISIIINILFTWCSAF